ncbi:hypothetical protein BCR33DRAFT_815924 [Rhizoclosmatium globosum]|uniref:SAM domain-containing protein n=1 Tax=Rhizoclosmatium globosum TaxID=329046 RepID=A0A1Y2CE30_9FUNG|nr:hypothetical protein BCR33DRAFT_815924 [Rhizoclosmatium globosum]|eukprot:ORY45321.1 hypothetical protein BCR33DRAFT_815924 [Rhizoclosmatium globosum]
MTTVATYNYTAVFSGDDLPCQPQWLERIDYTLASCTPTPVSNKTCAYLSPSPSPGRLSAITGCLSSTDTLTLGKDTLLSIQSDSTARVQFWSYTDTTCSTKPISITELDAQVTNCNKNTLGLTTNANGTYLSERATVDFTGAIWRNYYVDEYCTQLLTSTRFPDTSTCASRMKVVRLPVTANVGFTERVLYKGPGCTNPTSVRYTFGREVCLEFGCDETSGSRVKCPTTDTLATEAKSLFTGSGTDNYVTISTFVDDKCQVLDYTESLCLDTCQAQQYLETQNPALFRGYSFKATLSGATVTYTVYHDKNCSDTFRTLDLSTDGRCSLNLGISSKILTVKGIDALMYNTTPSASTNGGLIGGIVGGAVAAILIVVAVGIWFYRRRIQAIRMETTSSVSKPALPLNRMGTAEPERVNSEDVENTAPVTISALELQPGPKANPLFNSIPSSIPAEPVNLNKKNEFVPLSANPEEWTIQQVAEWVSQNGGAADAVREQKIDGVALVSLTLEELYVTLKISTVGDRVRFKKALEKLILSPPSYSQH